MFSRLCNFNRLWKIWYAVLITTLQGYVIINAIRQYINYKWDQYNPRYGGAWDHGPMHVYIGCIVVASSLCGYLFYFVLINVRQPQTLLLTGNFQRISKRNISKSTVKLLQHKLPCSHILHFIIAACLLLPLPVIEMEKIRNEALAKEAIWNTNIDFFTEHFKWMTGDGLPNNSLPQTLHPYSVSLEFINFSIASILMLLKIPSMFWRSHRFFSIFFSALMGFNCLSWLMSYESASILIKWSWKTILIDSQTDLTKEMKYGTIFIMITLQCLLTISDFIAIFIYGNLQIVFSCFFLSNAKIRKFYIAIVVSIGFLIRIIMLIINAVLVTVFLRYFEEFRRTLFMVTVVLSLTNTIVNFLVWFTFTIKPKWDFCADFLRPENTIDLKGKSTGTVEPIYDRFQNTVTMGSSSSHSSDHGQTNDGPNSDNYIYMSLNSPKIPTISEDYTDNSPISTIQKKPRTPSFDYLAWRSKNLVSLSDNDLNQSNQYSNTDSFRSLQMFGEAKPGKIVKFQEKPEEGTIPLLNFFEQRHSSTDSSERKPSFLKVPDILNIRRSILLESRSESSLDQISTDSRSINALESRDEEALSSDV